MATLRVPPPTRVAGAPRSGALYAISAFAAGCASTGGELTSACCAPSEPESKAAAAVAIRRWIRSFLIRPSTWVKQEYAPRPGVSPTRRTLRVCGIHLGCRRGGVHPPRPAADPMDAQGLELPLELELAQVLGVEAPLQESQGRLPNE